MSGKWQGEIASLFHGAGIEIADFRAYQPGDHQRDINWKLSAKHGELWVNQYEWEFDADVHLFLDLTPNRSTGGDQYAISRVEQFVSDLALVAQRYHLCVQVRLPDRKHDTLEQLAVRRSEEWVEVMISAREMAARLRRQHYQSRIDKFIDLVIDDLSKRSLIMIVSDFLVADDKLTERVDLMVPQHLIGLVEIELPELLWRDPTTHLSLHHKRQVAHFSV